MGVTVTFMAILELVREGLIDIVQSEPYAPLHVRAGGRGRSLHLVADNSGSRTEEGPAPDEPPADAPATEELPGANFEAAKPQPPRSEAQDEPSHSPQETSE